MNRFSKLVRSEFKRRKDAGAEPWYSLDVRSVEELRESASQLATGVAIILAIFVLPILGGLQH